MNLATLPESHPLRNTPLGQIGAEYRNLQMKAWKRVAPDKGDPIKIARATFNQLSGPWIEFNEWRVTETLELPAQP